MDNLLPLLLVIGLAICSRTYAYSGSQIRRHEMEGCRKETRGLLAEQCVYPGKEWPCFSESTYDHGNGVISHSDELDEIVSLICNNPPTLDVIQGFCCWHPSCLQKCYPDP